MLPRKILEKIAIQKSISFRNYLFKQFMRSPILLKFDRKNIECCLKYLFQQLEGPRKMQKWKQTIIGYQKNEKKRLKFHGIYGAPLKRGFWRISKFDKNDYV